MCLLLLGHEPAGVPSILSGEHQAASPAVSALPHGVGEMG